MKACITAIILAFTVYSPSFASAGGDHSNHTEHGSKEAQVQQIFPEPFRVNKPAPEFTLTNQDGKKTGLRDFRRKVVVMNFIYTSCGETCPALIAKFKDVQNAMKSKIGKDVVLLTITIDPERDTPKVFKKYANIHGANPGGWFFLTGTQAEIDRVLNDYGIIYKKDEKGNFGHVNLIILIDKQGAHAYNFGGVSYPSKQIILKIEELLKQK